MRIAIISKADSSGGGASRVAEDLHDTLLAAGHEVGHWCTYAQSFGKTRHPLWGSGLSRRLSWFSYGVSKYLGLGETIPAEAWPLLRARLWKHFDIVHIHDTTMALSPLAMDFLSRRMPVLWTMHDCSPFTGGCLYPMGCERYKAQCGNCPERGPWPLSGRFDNTSLFLKEKRWLHSSGRVALCAPSKWMAEKAEGSGNVRVPVNIVANGVDTDLFRPFSDEERSSLRRCFGIADDRPVILLSSWSLADRRKGAAEAARALHCVKDLNPFVILVGNVNPDLKRHLLPLEFFEAGYVSDRRLLALWYGLADFYLFPSRADNQPLSVLEAMSCGLGVMGFRVGGVAEMVEQGVDGFLVSDGDADGLGLALRDVLGRGLWKEWKAPARMRAVEHHNMETFRRNHEDLYRKTIEKWSRAR